MGALTGGLQELASSGRQGGVLEEVGPSSKAWARAAE